SARTSWSTRAPATMYRPPSVWVPMGESRTESSRRESHAAAPRSSQLRASWLDAGSTATNVHGSESSRRLGLSHERDGDVRRPRALAPFHRVEHHNSAAGARKLHFGRDRCGFVVELEEGEVDSAPGRPRNGGGEEDRGFDAVSQPGEAGNDRAG